MRSSDRRLWTLSVFVFAAAARTLGQTDPALKSLADRYWDASMERSPTSATDLGDYRFNDRLFDLSEDSRLRWNQTLRGFLKEAQGLPMAGLSPADRLTRDLFERTIQDGLFEFAAQKYQYLPLDPLDGPQIKFPLILVSQPFRNAEDYRAYISRLRSFPKQVDDLIANLRKGVSLGITAPRVIIQKVLPQIRTHIVDDPARSEFHKPLQIADTVPASERDAIVKSLTDAIRDSVAPSYRKLLTFVENEYLPTCRDTVGIGAVPNGEKMYAELAYLNATVRVEPQGVHELGLSEVARLRGEMTKVQKEVGFEGSLDDFLAHMRTDPAQRFKTGEELYAAADAILQRTKPLMSKLFTRIRQVNRALREIENFSAPSAPVG